MLRTLRPLQIVSLVLLAIISLGTCGTATAAPTKNLLVDGGFERLGTHQGDTAWLAPADGGGVRKGVGRITEAGSDYAAYLRPATDYAAEWVQPLLPLVPGRNYVLTAWAKASQPGSQVLIGVRMQDTYPRLYRGLSGEGWERIELEFTAAEGWAQVVLSNTAESAILWDDISLQESKTAAERVAAEWDHNLQQGKPLYTGLVVNARGTGLERGMSPKISDTKGNLVFAGVNATFDQLITKGLVAYVRTLEDATTHPRLAVSEEYPLRLPLVVDAQGASGFPKTGVIIGEEDARRIRAATNVYDFLGRFAIVFVVD